MTMIIMASLGAAVGSVVRFLVQTRFNANPEWTVLGINWVAALLAGMIYGTDLSLPINTLMMAGFVGGFSTFSAPIIALVDGLESRSLRWQAVLNVVILFVGGIAIFWLGYGFVK